MREDLSVKQQDLILLALKSKLLHALVQDP